ncbi:MAG: hypothetical protein PVJ75_00080, partial [Chloroflexota bacterium]
MQMDRTRIIFVVIVGLAVLIVCGAVAYGILSDQLGGEEDATPTPAVAQSGGSATARPTPSVDIESPDPVFGPNYDPDDGLPTYICGADAFGSYFTLQ